MQSRNKDTYIKKKQSKNWDEKRRNARRLHVHACLKFGDRKRKSVHLSYPATQPTAGPTHPNIHQTTPKTTPTKSIEIAGHRQCQKLDHTHSPRKKRLTELREPHRRPATIPKAKQMPAKQNKSPTKIRSDKMML
jgi:hypothetical protein